jgi:hypothetical protein
VIVYVSLALLAYEVLATHFGWPLITDLSHTWPWCVLVWTYVAWLGLHFARAAELPLQVNVYALYLAGSLTWFVATLLLLGREVGLWR